MSVIVGASTASTVRLAMPLPIDPMQVDLDGALCEPEAPTDLLVGDTLREHLDDLVLPLGQRGIHANQHRGLSHQREM